MQELEALAGWMTEQGLGEGPLDDVSEISGGTQNILLRFTRSGRPFAFRGGSEAPMADQQQGHPARDSGPRYRPPNLTYAAMTPTTDIGEGP